MRNVIHFIQHFIQRVVIIRQLRALLTYDIKTYVELSRCLLTSVFMCASSAAMTDSILPKITKLSASHDGMKAPSMCCYRQLCYGEQIAIDEEEFSYEFCLIAFMSNYKKVSCNNLFYGVNCFKRLHGNLSIIKRIFIYGFSMKPINFTH